MEKILVVDDDVDLLEMMTLLLKSQQFAVKSLSSGARFWETIDEESPDAVIMDIFLGDSDGRDLCRQLKESAGYRSIPVLLYSAGHITQSSVEASGADDFLPKPFDMFEMLRRVRQRLDDKPA